MSTDTRTGAGAGQAIQDGPYVGRNVIFGFGHRGETGIEQRAALITRINVDGTAQLAVFNPGGEGMQPMKAGYSETLELNCWSPAVS